MNRELIRKIVFILVMILYIVIPALMIMRYEKVLSDGEVFRFRAMPVDPYDSFRGKYISLRFVQEDASSLLSPDSLTEGEDVFVALAKGDSGFAVITSLSPTEVTGRNYFIAKIKYVSNDRVTLEFPFNRYFMNEDLAPLAEDAYRDNTRNGQGNVYVDVRVHEGKTVIEEVYINGMPLNQYLRSFPKQP